MFTGIIETSGTVLKAEHVHSNLLLYIQSDLTPSLKIDQSIAHNGVCLTVDEVSPEWHRCTLIQETLEKTNFKDITGGDIINLERSLTTQSRMDGHFVQGHVDGVSTCISVLDMDGSWVYSFSLPSEFKSLVVLKGSICINGVSLTISELNETNFSVSIIPYTYYHTNFKTIKKGDRVNIEYDILGKYIKRMLDMRG
jgi:riboflavin synthase